MPPAVAAAPQAQAPQALFLARHVDQERDQARARHYCCDSNANIETTLAKQWSEHTGRIANSLLLLDVSLCLLCKRRRGIMAWPPLGLCMQAYASQARWQSRSGGGAGRRREEALRCPLVLAYRARVRGVWMYFVPCVAAVVRRDDMRDRESRHYCTVHSMSIWNIIEETHEHTVLVCKHVRRDCPASVDDRPHFRPTAPHHRLRQPSLPFALSTDANLF
jgi:hypothetical protein